MLVICDREDVLCCDYQSDFTMLGDSSEIRAAAAV